MNSILIHYCKAQVNSIQGKVICKTDSLPVGFAHVYFANSNIGTYSNAVGQFVLRYEDSERLDTLVISRLGFNTVYKPISDLKDSTLLTVGITQNSRFLDEVYVYAEKDTVSSIVKKAFRKFRKNYPTKLHYLEGFYRELSLKGDTCTRLIEAAVGITENSYRKPYTKSRVQIRKIRKSEDYRSYSARFQAAEAVLRKISKLAHGKLYMHYNSIHRLLIHNIARSNRIVGTNRRKNKSVLLKKYEYRIAEVSTQGKDEIYHIEFRQPPNLASPATYTIGRIAINMSDYGILEHSWSIVKHPYKDFIHQNLFYKGEIQMYARTLYSKIDDKYYPTLLELLEPAPLGTGLFEDERTGEKHRQYVKSTLMINKVLTRKRDFDKIKKRDAVEDEEDLYDINQEYDATFWSTYNVLLLNPLSEPVLRDLERNHSLKVQFGENEK